MKLNEKAESKKTQLLAGLVAARRHILEETAALPAKDQDQIFLGSWSARDLLAHLIGWDFANLQAVKEILSGTLPSFYAHHDRDWETFNAELVAQYKRGQLASLVAAAKESHQQLVNHLETIPADEFARERGIRFRGFKVTIERLLQAETHDEEVHSLQVKAFREHSGQQVAK